MGKLHIDLSEEASYARIFWRMLVAAFVVVTLLAAALGWWIDRVVKGIWR